MKSLRQDKLKIIPILIVAFALLVGLSSLAPAGATARPEEETTYRVKATGARLNREVQGTVNTTVQGVPASPVDSFVHDGEGSTRLTNAVAHVAIDPVSNEGKIWAQWKDRNGKWKFVQEVFLEPPHSTGLRVGPAANSTELVYDDPVTTNVYLHGDTTAGGPVLPTLFNYLATWGVAEVTLNGKPFVNTVDDGDPEPNWAAHTMTSAGARNETGAVLAADGQSIFSPAAPYDGYVDHDGLEFHIVFHDAPGPAAPGNFPPPLDFFYHLTFEDVTVDIAHID